MGGSSRRNVLVLFRAILACLSLERKEETQAGRDAGCRSKARALSLERRATPHAAAQSGCVRAYLGSQHSRARCIKFSFVYTKHSMCIGWILHKAKEFIRRSWFAESLPVGLDRVFR